MALVLFDILKNKTMALQNVTDKRMIVLSMASLFSYILINVILIKRKIQKASVFLAPFVMMLLGLFTFRGDPIFIKAQAFFCLTSLLITLFLFSIDKKEKIPNLSMITLAPAIGIIITGTDVIQ